jgi:hypothetical protein
MRTPVSPRLKLVVAGLMVATALIAAVAGVAMRTRPVRQAVTAYTHLLGAANRQDVDAARRLCTARYLAGHHLEPAAEGGIVGLPRNAHPNFQAWRQGTSVWVCPTNRVGPVYQFVFEDGRWKFDGPVGLLRGRGEFLPQDDLTEQAAGGRSHRPGNPVGIRPHAVE